MTYVLIFKYHTRN